MLKPVLPYLTDLAEHILNFESHIATVHAHDGKFHVHNEVAEGAKNDNTEKSTDPVVKKGASGTEHIVSEKFNYISLLKTTSLYPAEISTDLTYIYLPGKYPPPKA